MKTLRPLLKLTIGAIALTIGSCSSPETNLATTPIVAQPSPLPTAKSPTAKNNNLPTSFQKVTVVQGLERPWGMAWLPDGAILITERVGRVQILQNGVLEQVAIAKIPNLFVSGQAGLMDISLHPRFAENRLVYFTYSAGDSQSNHTSILRAKFDGKAFTDSQVIFEVTPSKSSNQHFGSRLT